MSQPGLKMISLPQKSILSLKVYENYVSIKITYLGGTFKRFLDSFYFFSRHPGHIGSAQAGRLQNYFYPLKRPALPGPV
jgi:hypothetical protein